MSDTTCLFKRARYENQTSVSALRLSVIYVRVVELASDGPRDKKSPTETHSKTPFGSQTDSTLALRLALALATRVVDLQGSPKKGWWSPDRRVPASRTSRVHAHPRLTSPSRSAIISSMGICSHQTAYIHHPANLHPHLSSSFRPRVFRHFRLSLLPFHQTPRRQTTTAAVVQGRRRYLSRTSHLIARRAGWRLSSKRLRSSSDCLGPLALTDLLLYLPYLIVDTLLHHQHGRARKRSHTSTTAPSTRPQRMPAVLLRSIPSTRLAPPYSPRALPNSRDSRHPQLIRVRLSYHLYAYFESAHLRLDSNLQQVPSIAHRLQHPFRC